MFKLFYTFEVEKYIGNHINDPKSTFPKTCPYIIYMWYMGTF